MVHQTEISKNKVGGSKQIFGINARMQDCIDLCNQCAQACGHLIPHCLELGSEHAGLDHIRSLLDCADLCASSAKFMVRESDLHTKLCGLCTEACIQCAETCEKMGLDDQEMKSCAEICRKCAKSCEEMAHQH